MERCLIGVAVFFFIMTPLWIELVRGQSWSVVSKRLIVLSLFILFSLFAGIIGLRLRDQDTRTAFIGAVVLAVYWTWVLVATYGTWKSLSKHQ